MTHADLAQLDAGGRLRRLFGDSAVYGLAGALNKLLALVTFPLLARCLSVADYGTVDVFMIAANWLALIIMCGVDSATCRLMLDHADDTERAQIVSQALAWLALVAAFVIPAAWWVAAPLARLVGQADATALIVPLVCLQLPFLVVCGLAQGLLRWTFQRRRYLVLSLGASAATALLLVVAVSSTTLRPHHVFIIALAVQVAFALLSLRFMRRWLVWPQAFARWRVILPIAVPLGIIAAAGAAMPLLERSLVATIAAVGDRDGLGLYAAGAKVAGLLALPIMAFQSGWGPFIVALSRERDAARTYNAALLVYTWAIGLLVLMLAGLGPWILRGLASERYVAGSLVVFPLAMALAVQGMGWMFEAGISIAKRTHLSLLAYAALLVVFLPSALMLREPLGIAGVAFAMLAGQTAFALLTALFAHHAHPLEWQPGTAIVLLSATAIAGAAHSWTAMRWGVAVAAPIGVGALLVLMAAALVPGPLRNALQQLIAARQTPPTDRG